ncbi:MAG TPA: hypothetical protein VFT96_10610 [Gemmatimonadaceae bacterium]|nr:hypothetical protein [Gemmatimonadaceae bacterium]
MATSTPDAGDDVAPSSHSRRADVEARLRAAEAEASTAARAVSRLSGVRLGYAAAAVVLLTLAGWSWPLGALAVLLFLPLAYVHRRFEARAQHARGVVSACRASLARMARDWKAMPQARAPELPGLTNTIAAHDLDVLGDVSLFRLLDVGLPIGGECTVRWLLTDPADLRTIEARQVAVAALRERTELLFESARVARFGVGRRPPPTQAQMAAFRAWCEQPVRPLSKVLVIGARLLVFALAGAVAMALAAPRLRDAAMLIATIVVPLQLVLSALARRHIRAGLGAAADTLARLGDVVTIMRMIVDEPAVAGRFGDIQRSLAGGHAVAAFTRLRQLLDWDAVRYSPLMHYAANATVAFDVHLADRLGAWHLRHAAAIPGWIDLVAEAQALTAFATLGYENPDWVLPTLHDRAVPVVEARDCGHPLIASDVRVSNPVALSQPAETLVITGSNMSGKTTYLRAVGLNALLALAGGPVCASAMTIRRSRVRTSVRIEDDLSRGSSLFFAEVARIRDVVADAERNDAPPVLFLLDEILHGTNAADRRQATQLVLERLMHSGSTGIITTHDAGVGVDAGATVMHRHFTDTVHAEGAGVRMTFDYTLRDGPATTTNALRILELLGLREHEPTKS